MRFFIGFLILIFLGLAFLFVIQAGWYPVVVVDSEIIWGRTLNKATQAALTYYQKKGMPIKPENRKEAREAILDKLIEKVLVSKWLEESSNPEALAQIQETVSKYSNQPNLDSATSLAYGLTLEEFYDLILLPQAQREWLEKKLAEENKKLGDWLKNKKQTANIVWVLKKIKRD